MRFACEAVRLSIGEMPASQVRGMTSRTARRIRLAALLLAMVGPVAAQVPPDQLRAQVESARLGTGYAQMINLSATPDLSAASYRVDMEGGADSTLDVLRLPYQAKWLPLSADSDLYWKVAGGYLRLKHDFPYALSPAVNGSVGSNWTAYSVSGGVLAKVRLGNGFTLEPALDAAVARLENSTSYVGAASILQPILDGLVFNWTTNAWLVTPSVGLEWTDGNPDGKTTVRGHVARSWITSFDETDPIQHFSEAANIYSARAEYSRPTQMRVFDRPLAGVVYAGYAGFFGADRHALGFDAVAEVGAGLELPIAADKPLAERARLSGAYLFGTDVRGWTIGISVEY